MIRIFMAKDASYEKPYNLKRGADSSKPSEELVPEVEAEQYRGDHDPRIIRFREEHRKYSNQDFW